jgi:hypothetical protein
MALDVTEIFIERFCIASHLSDDFVSRVGHVEARVLANFVESIDESLDVSPGVCLEVESVCSPSNVLPPFFDGSLLLLELTLSEVNALIESVNEAELCGIQG